MCSGCAVGQTGGAFRVGGTDAYVQGSLVSDAGGQIEYWAEYGPTDGYGSQTPHSQITAGKLQVVSVLPIQITGLERSTTYHYRVCAQDGSQRGGPGCGTDATFATQAVHCGDTVTRDVRLVASMLCGGSFTRPGLVIGAPDVQIDLNGFRLQGPGAIPSQTPVAIDNTGGFAGLTVRNGSVSGWGVGVELDDATGNRMLDLDATGNTSGVTIRGGSGHVIRRSSMTGTRYGLGLGVVDSDDLVVADSGGILWLVRGNRARVVRNELTPAGPFSICLNLFGSDHRIAYNKISGCDSAGIMLQAGANDRFVGNESSNSTDGISIGAFTTDTLLRANYAHDNLDDGIDVHGTGTRLRDNRADDNGDFGIDAVAGVTDLGGNTASGNGNPLQCRNVFCS